MSKASDNPFPSVLIVEGTAPANPPSGDQRVYIDTADHKLKRVNSSGTVTTIEGGGTTLALAKAVRTSGDITVTSTTFADLDGTNLSLTITTGAHHVKVGWLVGAHNSASADNMCIDVTVDGTRQGQTFGLTLSSNVASDNCNLSGTYLTDALSAASHTFKLQARVDGGTGTFFSSTSVSPIVFWVEECAS